MTELESGRSGPLARPFLTFAALAALAVLIGLGVWQLQRLRWKEDLVARIEALRAAPARPLGSVLAEQAAGGDVDYARVMTDCPGLDDAPFVTLYALESRVTGIRVLSACPVAEGPYDAVLVDRGFLSDADAQRLRPAASSDEAGVHRAVVGVLRSPSARSFAAAPDEPKKNLWFNRDAPAMARKLGVTGQVAPIFLFLESPPPAGFGPQPSPVPVDISNRHLGYAITWFGLAAALLGVYLAMMFKRPNRA